MRGGVACIFMRVSCTARVIICKYRRKSHDLRSYTCASISFITAFLEHVYFLVSFVNLIERNIKLATEKKIHFTYQKKAFAAFLKHSPSPFMYKHTNVTFGVSSSTRQRQECMPQRFKRP